jgi:hypothetical protein
MLYGDRVGHQLVNNSLSCNPDQTFFMFFNILLDIIHKKLLYLPVQFWNDPNYCFNIEKLFTMKKIILLVILASIMCFADAQRQPANNLPVGRINGNVATPRQWRHFSKDNLQVPLKKAELFHPESLIWKWDTIVGYDTLGSITYRHTQTFDIQGKVLIQKTEYWLTNAWENMNRWTYTYDANGKILTGLYERWQINAWVNSSRWTNTYDIHGNLLTELNEDWQTNAWVNYARWTDTFDTNGNMLTELYEEWQTNAWLNSSRWTDTYDSMGNTLTSLYEEWQTNAWVNSGRWTYTYDTNGNMLTALYEEWQTSTWVISYRYTYTYDISGNELTELDEQWQTNTWVNSTRYTFTYDGNGNELTELDEYWQTNTWLNYYRYTYTYDANGNSLTGKYETWRNSNWVTGLGYLYLFSQKNEIYLINDVYSYDASYISFIAGISILPSDRSSINVYPNPACNKITVSVMQFKTERNAFLSVYDMQGKFLIQQSLQKGKTEIDLSGYSKGIYFLRVTNDDQTETARILKE